VYDLAGNVWEWCRDGSSMSSARSLQRNAILVDPVGSPSSNTRVLKGGSYFNDERFLIAAGRNLLHPEAAESVVGFRVAWPASPP
jgi:formylglycine-generating enzyme required for sulfatase activity